MPEPTVATDEPDDAVLLARWRGGEERAATLLVLRHAPALARFVASLGERREAEEVVHAQLWTETIIAVSNDDEVNILASLLAKRFGCERSVTLINKTTYAPLIGTLGIDAVVNPRTITVSTILQHVRRGRVRSGCWRSSSCSPRRTTTPRPCRAASASSWRWHAL